MKFTDILRQSIKQLSRAFKKPKELFLLLLIVCLALFFRLININWDSGHHLHPDERFLSMVANDLELPKPRLNFLDQKKSTLNPRNHDYDFFVYGTFPVVAVKIISVLFNFDSYSKLFLLGRTTSAILDAGIVLLIFLIVQLFENKSKLNKKLKFWASFIYVCSVLH
jgi:hypothetical protein